MRWPNTRNIVQSKSIRYDVLLILCAFDVLPVEGLVSTTAKRDSLTCEASSLCSTVVLTDEAGSGSGIIREGMLVVGLVGGVAFSDRREALLADWLMPGPLM